MDAHRLKSVQLTQFYLHRIRKLNPTLNAVITVSPTALADARAADAARRRGDDRPLLGIPIIVKDNINTTGMATTAGSWALAGSTPDDAFIVQQLKAAGALIIGKANLSEWANFRSGPSSSGWSGIGGQTNMAYVLDRNPCGSSSGSGVIASADLAVAAVGTETDGSIVCPSGANANAGIKPTLGLLSRAGVVPISADQDTAGPMARNVTDAAVLLGAMTGVDPDDPATAEQVGNAFTDYTQFLDANALARRPHRRLARGQLRGRRRTGRRGRVRDHGRHDRGARGRRARRSSTRPTSRSATGRDAEFPALLCEFKTDIATYLETYTEGQPGHRWLSEDAPGPDRLQQRPSRARIRGARVELELADLRPRPGRPAGATPTAPRLRAVATPGAQAAIDDSMADARPRRDHRPDQRTGVGHGPGQRRPRWRLLDVHRFVGSGRGRGLRERDGARGLRRAAAGRRVVHRRPLGRADADRPRVCVRAGDPGTRPAGLHPDDR